MSNEFQIEGFILRSKELKKGRWIAVVENNETGEKIKISFAQYVWLKENPSFKTLPRGYLIHHLDWDPLNDDISNLALMYKHHHTAHHFKGKKEAIPIRLTDSNWKEYGIPTKKPKVRMRTDRVSPTFYVDYPTRVRGKFKQMKIFSWHGAVLKKQEEAEKVIGTIWPDNPWEFAI